MSFWFLLVFVVPSSTEKQNIKWLPLFLLSTYTLAPPCNNLPSSEGDREEVLEKGGAKHGVGVLVVVLCILRGEENVVSRD